MPYYHRFLYILSFAAMFLPLMIERGQAEAQEAEAFRTPVIAIIEYAKIERNSTAWTDFSEQFEKVKNEYQADIKKQQDALQERQKKLQEQASVLSPESFAAEEKKFRDAVLELQRLTDKRKRDLDSVFNKAIRQFRLNIASIAAEVAREHKVDIVLNTSQNASNLFFWSEDLSITEEVSKRFNEKFPKSSITVGEQ